MKIFLDDVRPTPAGWTRAYWPEEVISLMQTQDVDEISLDHDLGDEAHGTGYDVILWIEEAVASRKFTPPKIFVHSANPPAHKRMLDAIRAIERLTRQSIMNG